jgi:asparagine synthase (glutamine-hydrolysing)
MSGIAGIVSSRPVPADVVRRMSAAQAHRGTNEVTVDLPGIALAIRSHAAVTSADVLQGDPGRRVLAFMDGALYNASALPNTSSASSEVAANAQYLAARWRDRGAELLENLRGQFAVVVWDEAEHRLLLGRDHFGVCPMHWSRQGDCLLFASEIKALLASGLIDKQVDLQGINHVWTFFGVPGPTTCFKNISALPPAWLLESRLAPSGEIEEVRTRQYWRMDFPAAGNEDDVRGEDQLVEQYSAIMQNSVGRRLTGHPSIAMYSSGGLDSSMLLSMASKCRDKPINTYTFNIRHPDLDESALATAVGQYTGSRQHVVDLSGRDLLDAFPRVVRAAESPVIDVSASALFQLAERAHQDGYSAVITGEGADELQAGYPWFRIRERLNRLDRFTKLPLSGRGFQGYLRWIQGSRLPWSFVQRSEEIIGRGNAWLLAYSLMASAKWRFFSRETIAELGEHVPFDDLLLDREGLRRWNSLNRSIYLGTRIHLPGLHLCARGDRAAGRNGVETRYPFLDREVFDFLAPLAPRWKIRGLTDKYLQRQLAKRWLPETVTAGRKSLLHAPLDALHRAKRPAWAEQLLAEEALRKTPYFDAQAVRRWMAIFPTMRHGFRRLFVEMGLVGVLTTQLWHQLYIDSSLADLD